MHTHQKQAKVLYTVLLCARDQPKGVSATLQSLDQQTVPRHLFEIYVVGIQNPEIVQKASSSSAHQNNALYDLAAGSAIYFSLPQAGYGKTLNALLPHCDK